MPVSHRQRMRYLAPGVTAAVIAGLALTSPSTAGAAPGAGSPSALSTVGTSRVLTQSLSGSFPTGQKIGTPAGFQSPELPKQGQGDEQVGTRSHSVRPGVSAALRAGGAMAPPVVAGTAVHGGKPGLLQSFEGLNSFDQRYANNGNQFSVEPPDQALCVGKGRILEATNDVLQVYKTGGGAASAVTDLNTFFGYPAQYNRVTGKEGPFVTDPVCLFDQSTQRFFVTVLTLAVDPTTGALTGGNTLDTAVSKTADPSGGYRIYRLPVQNDGTQGTAKHEDCPCIGDYPHIGADANGIYLTTNEYPISSDPGVYGNNFNGAQIYGFNKFALAAGAKSVHGVEFSNTALNSGGAKVPGFTVWPAHSAQADYATEHNGTEYLLSSIAGGEAQPVNPTGYAHQIGVFSLTNTTSLRTTHPNVTLTRALINSGVYGVPPYVVQKVGPVPLRDCTLVDCLSVGATDPTASEGPLNANDSRMQQTWYAHGKIFGALDTIARVGGNIQAAIAWYVVDPGTTPARASMSKQGYLGVVQNNVTYPTMATLPNGQGAMAFTLVGKSYYPSAGYAKMTFAGPGAVNVAAAGAAPQDGFTEYPFWSGSFRPRWGDYGGAAIDGGKVWIASEYIAHRCTFAQYVKDFTCGGTRAALTNWSTRISQLTP